MGGVTYLLQVATNLDTPTAWETIATNVAVTSGLIQFLDPGTNNAAARYYRTLMPSGVEANTNTTVVRTSVAGSGFAPQAYGRTGRSPR